MKTSRIATTILAVVLLGGTVIAATRGLRAGPPSLPQPVPSGHVPASTGADAATRSRAMALLGKLPLAFIENRGQEDPQVAYYVQGRDTAVYFTSTGLTLALTGKKGDGAATDPPSRRLPVRRVSTAPERSARERWAVRLDFVGAQPVTPRGVEPKAAVVSYFKGGDDASTTALKTFGSLVYPELWPGIDLVYTGNAGRLKYTFLVKPGADPAQIRLAYRGTSAVTLTDAGQLHIATPAGAFADDRPYAYQEGHGRRDEVPATYALAAATPDGARGYGFTLGRYDRTRPLVLDPSLLVYAGYIGGTGDELARGIAVDGAGNAYVVGTTDSAVPSFPAKVGPALIFSGSRDAFVAKVKADGTDLVYLGYIGGAGEDEGAAIAVDKAGNAYITGFTGSDEATFPVKVGPSLIHGGNGDAFVCKVKADGTALVYCGYIGGADFDGGAGIAVDAGGNVYVAGLTESDETSFPVRVGPDLSFNGGFGDAFVAKVKADGTTLLYAGYIGGAGDDSASAIAVDASGNAYLTGFTASDQNSFPVKVGPDLNFNGGFGDAFVAKVKPDGTALLYAGYIGGGDLDEGHGIAVDAAGNAYVTGRTESDQTSFPVKVGPDLVFNGGTDAFVAKVKPDGTTLLYAGYIGGASTDEGFAIAVDATGSAYITGLTSSNQTSFPVRIGPDLVFNGGLDTFVAQVKPDGTELLYAGYLGGADFDLGLAIAVDTAGNAYVAGLATSDQTSFPVMVGPDLSFAGGGDAFVAKISGKPELLIGGVAVSTSVAKPGGTFAVADATGNLGLGTAKPSTTRYYLSTDTVKSANDLLLGGSRAIPSLEPGRENAGNATVTVPANTAPGSYRVLACADDTKAIAENDEANNCSAVVGTVQVALPDLVVIGVSNPPLTAVAGTKIVVSDTTVNVAAVSTPASTTRYHLSKDGIKGPGDVLLLGNRAVPAVAANTVQGGNLSSGSLLVTIPPSTPAGVYRVLTCADDTKVVKESIETNNCAASPGAVQVIR